MFVDYDYYKNDFKGCLSEDEFNKFINLACSKITIATMSRVTDSTIGNYPSELIKNIKDCACSLLEKLKSFDDALNVLSSSINGESNGMIKSSVAGAVSVTYDTTSGINFLLNKSNQESIINSVINSYLSARCIGGKFYNLLSKSLSSRNFCKSCNI